MNDDYINLFVVVKVCEVDGLLCICFYVCRDILIGEEIIFNNSKLKNVDDYFWCRNV